MSIQWHRKRYMKRYRIRPNLISAKFIERRILNRLLNGGSRSHPSPSTKSLAYYDTTVVLTFIEGKASFHSQIIRSIA